MLHPAHAENVGGVIRAAGCFDADYVSTIGHEYKGHATSVGHDRHVPIWYHDSFRDLKVSLPYATEIVAVDYNEDATKLSNFQHPERALYILGQEGPGFEEHEEVLERADRTVYIDAEYCMNMAVAGNMILRDRYNERTT